MNLVSNFIGEISSFQFGDSQNITKNFDLNDFAFSNILDEKMQINIEKPINNNQMNLGMPSGFQIDAFDSNDNIVKELNVVENSNNYNNENFYENSQIEHSIEEIAYMSSPFLDIKSNTETQNEVFDFARKQVTNLYSKYSRSPIEDLNGFVNKIHNIMK